VASIEVSGLSVTPKAEAYRIFDRIWPTVCFLNDVVDINAAAAKIMADAASAM